jgi:hypothetical protein
VLSTSWVLHLRMTAVSTTLSNAGCKCNLEDRL